MTGEQRSLLLPSDASARKYVDSRISTGIRGTSEESLRVVRGRVDTTGPTILQGGGFTVAKNGTGDVTATFATAFSGVPTVLVSTEGVGVRAENRATPTTTTARVYVTDLSGGAVEGVIHFVAVGPE